MTKPGKRPTITERQNRTEGIAIKRSLYAKILALNVQVFLRFKGNSTAAGQGKNLRLL